MNALESLPEYRRWVPSLPANGREKRPSPVSIIDLLSDEPNRHVEDLEVIH